MPWPEPVTLKGRFATLVPLQPSHVEELTAAVRDGELWKLWYTNVPAPERMAAEIERLGAKLDGVLRSHMRHQLSRNFAGPTA
jgi:hypothetical protein